MGFGTTTIKRAVAAAFVATLALTQFVAAQEVTPYEAPDNIEEIEGSIATDGSSTVGPLTAAVVESFAEVAPGIDIVVDISGSGGGFARFCEGETVVSNASRQIAEDEIAICAENGYDYYQFNVAMDGLTVVVNSENDFADCLTVDQLNQLWAPDSTITMWSELDPEWPEEPITLYGPGPDSGTFDYFTEVINGEAGASRTDYQPSEDDNVLVQGVANDPFALAYFGYAYYLENKGTLQAVAIDGGDGCVEPSDETVADGSYTPLTRPLFIYVRADALREEEAVQEFIRYYIANSSDLAVDVGYTARTAEQVAQTQSDVEGAIDGSLTPTSQSGGESATPEATPAS
ncbi:MAG: PstS family phosphate ABC transporter substrate-binding protein [Chloroflexota bacterium]|jgi:phosphate transport system substrate-binding protein|nr:PstS family phosphate ABC transporter substrate-binding protein [Chloroflexota bacterium]